jgi:hypothetical protein
MCRHKNTRNGLLSVRTALVLLLALLAAGGAGALTLLARHSLAEATLAGLAALAAGMRFFHWLIT